MVCSLMATTILVIDVNHTRNPVHTLFCSHMGKILCQESLTHVGLNMLVCQFLLYLTCAIMVSPPGHQVDQDQGGQGPEGGAARTEGVSQ